MKKFLLAGVALTGLVAGAGAVSAADLPARSAPMAPIAVPAVPIFTWTGFYVGVNAGYGWQNNEDNSFFVPPGTFITAPAASGVVSFAEDDGDGFVGGAQIGYNYQIGGFVVGLETDLQWADLGGSNNGTAFVPAGFPPTFVPAGSAGGVDWFGTVRARLGFAFDRALIYATGGFAYGGVDTDNDTFGLVNSDDDVRTGWALGGGVEYAFTQNLTLFLEGLWVNLDGEDNNGTFVGTEVIGGVTTPVFAAGIDRGDNENDFFVARAKLNFKF
jgi:outer membrane immunogenic protein